MFDKEEVREQIIQYFKSVGSGENIVQAIKQALFLNQNFNPLLLFEVISQGRQVITRHDWRRYLTKRSISFTEEEINYFFRNNHFGHEISFNQFLEGLIPYNADVIREFKAKYLDALEVQEQDPEVEFIFAELMSNWIGFFRTLIKLRSEISQKVTKKQIQHLVKEDLVLHSKPREARKFHESFQELKFEISFHELRKFLELWVTSSKELLHEFCLLNVKRHLKCENPFSKIVYKHKKSNQSRSRSISNSHSVSRKKQKSVSQTETKRRVTIQKKKKNNNFGQFDFPDELRVGKSKTKYENYKRELQQSLKNELAEEQNGSGQKYRLK